MPATSLVVLIGPAGSGKSAFANLNFRTDAIVSSDQLRKSLAGTGGPGSRYDVFNEVLEVVEPRLAAGKLTVVDATNADWMRRADLIRLSRKYGRTAIAIVFALPVDVCLARNASREDKVPPSVIRRHAADISRDIDRLDLEGFADVHVFRNEGEVQQTRVELDAGTK
jgi:predicted kinase